MLWPQAAEYHRSRHKDATILCALFSGRLAAEKLLTIGPSCTLSMLTRQSTLSLPEWLSVFLRGMGVGSASEATHARDNLNTRSSRVTNIAPDTAVSGTMISDRSHQIDQRIRWRYVRVPTWYPREPQRWHYSAIVARCPLAQRPALAPSTFLILSCTVFCGSLRCTAGFGSVHTARTACRL